MTVNAVAPWEGKLIWVGEPKRGRSSGGNEWASVDFTLEYKDHQMKDSHITFVYFGVENVEKVLAIPIGTAVRVQWVPDARESNGKWWPKFSVFGIRVLDGRDEEEERPRAERQPRQERRDWRRGTVPDQAPAYRGKQYQPQESGESDLPF